MDPGLRVWITEWMAWARTVAGGTKEGRSERYCEGQTDVPGLGRFGHQRKEYGSGFVERGMMRH